MMASTSTIELELLDAPDSGSDGPRTRITRSPAREYFTVDLRGLRTSLLTRAKGAGLTPSDFLRRALVAKLGLPDDVEHGDGFVADGATRSSCAKLSIRVPVAAAEKLARQARTAGLSRGAYVTGLICGDATIMASTDRAALVKALNQSTAELALMARDIRHLTTLVRQGTGESARAYGERFRNLDADVRSHLAKDAKVLAELSVGARRDSVIGNPRRGA